VDLGGTVIGTVKVITADSDGNVGGDAGFGRIRIEGGGEVADGKFGGWLRFEPTGGTWTINDDHVAGNAWWKPIDQLKLGIGGNPDGIWGKEGNAGWMFYQSISDTGVVDQSNVWGGGFGGGLMLRSKSWSWDATYCGAFFGGWDDPRLFIEISPVDIVGINIAIPFFSGGAIEDIFMSTIAQVDLNMSFGNIALTYWGSPVNIKNSRIFGFFSLTAIDNLQLDFGLGANFLDTDPIKLGFAIKYGRDTWGIKFRTMFAIPTRSDQSFGMLFDVLPYFVINENFRAYISAGINIASIDDVTAGAGWHVNPYIEVGEEWGPKFGAGIKVWAESNFTSPTVNFEIPIALIVSF